MKVELYFGESLGRYSFGTEHPFGPDRLHSFWRETVKQGLNRKVKIREPVLCLEEDLANFHTISYIDRVKELSKTGTGYLDKGDTPAFPGMFEAASYVVGSGLDGISQILYGSNKKIFIPIAGLHHARRNEAAGFCVFNDCGVLIETLKKKYSMQKIAYVDIDAHHADGVFYAFEEDPALIFVDIHEDGRFLYPGTGFANETGRGKARGSKLNIPMPPGSDDAAFQLIWPVVEDFLRDRKPEIILFQAGADCIAGDPITHLQYSTQVHTFVTKRLCAIADEYCKGRIIAMGGGGYNLTNLALAWNAVLEAMIG